MRTRMTPRGKRAARCGRSRRFEEIFGLGAALGLLLMLGSGLAHAQARPDPRNPAQPDPVLSIETDDPAKGHSGDRPWAEGVPHAVRARANQLFLRGNELIKEALFAKAAEKYQQAIALWPHPAFHYNLGIAHNNLGQPIAAYQRFTNAQRFGPAPIGQDKYDQATEYLTMLSGQLATIEITCDQPGATVIFDGKPIADCPARTRVVELPGGHTVEANKPGYETDTQPVVLDPGDQQQITVAAKAPQHLATERYWPRWLPWLVGGAGGLVGTGAYAMQRTSSNLFDDYDARIAGLCTGPDGCSRDEVPAATRDRLTRARAWQWGARVGYAVSIATLATGGVLLFYNRERVVQRRGVVDASAPTSAAPVITPTVTRESVGISAQLRF